MSEILFNFEWMGINVGLALLAVLFGYLAFKLSQKIFRGIFFVLLLIFIPNTIYIFTDLLHLPEQLDESTRVQKIFVSIQYFAFEIAGFLSFIVALYFFERILELFPLISKKVVPYLIFVFNFLIGFGVVLGRIQRVNSWDIFTNTEGVIYDSLNILTSFELLVLVIFFGLLGNAVYFLARNRANIILQRFFK